MQDDHDDDDAEEREPEHERRDPAVLLLQWREVDLLAGHRSSLLGSGRPVD